jgi:hypothetical protein
MKTVAIMRIWTCMLMRLEKEYLFTETPPTNLKSKYKLVYFQKFSQ